MKRSARWYWFLLAWTFATVTGVRAQPADPARAVTYSLLDGSHFVDECLVCGRPTILQPMRGTFDLVLLQNTPPFRRYAVRNVDFIAHAGWSGEVRIAGEGVYERFEEFARIQRLILATQVRDDHTNRPAWFTNHSDVAQVAEPRLEITLTETNGTWLQTFSLHVIAAPLHEVWFSTTKSLVPTKPADAPQVIGPGDLISNRGRVVKRNPDLVGRLGVMPIVPDLGLDAVDVGPRGEVLFSLAQTVWSETRGWLDEGDLFSKRGDLVERLSSPLAKFGVTGSPARVGLDAVQRMPDGEFLFSIRSNVVVHSGLTLAHGDILSDDGRVFRTQRELLVNFHPEKADHDYGLDALHVLPGGELWFSVEEGFTDRVLGPVSAGDVLSSHGVRVFSNRQLVAAFAPADSTQDYGLDALFLVTDLHSSGPPPRITRLRHSDGAIRVDWEGDGRVFQLEHAPTPGGPWQPCGAIQPDLSAEDASNPNPAPAGFYRVRQW